MISAHHMKVLLKEREKNGRPVRVAVVGAGWFGSGVFAEINRWPGMSAPYLFCRDAVKGAKAVVAADFPKDRIKMVETSNEIKSAIERHHPCLISDIGLLDDLEDVDAVFDATGDVSFGIELAQRCLKRGLCFITASSELDATFGPLLAHWADAHDAVYSNTDGDQPGCLARIIQEVDLYGFRTVVAANCKGFLDPHKAPQDILPWVRPGHSVKMVTSFTDGTKQAMELAVVANAFDLIVDKPGMHGVRTTKHRVVQDLTAVVSEEGRGRGVVEYTLGIDGVDQGAGVFVIAKREGERIRQDMNYLKKGPGPYCLFFRDHHLCYLEAPRTVAEAVLWRVGFLAFRTSNTQVFAMAKRFLKKGERLDGIGGETVYGLIDRWKVKEERLSIGLCESARLKRDIMRDEPILWSDVEPDEQNAAVRMFLKHRSLLQGGDDGITAEETSPTEKTMRP